MGTNYYHEPNTGGVCGHCGHREEVERVHIGKSSAGWTFSWHATETIRSAADWYVQLEAGLIFDEYDRRHSLDDFKAMVEGKRDSPHHHAREYPQGNFTDPEGHSFSEGGFS